MKKKILIIFILIIFSITIISCNSKDIKENNKKNLSESTDEINDEILISNITTDESKKLVKTLFQESGIDEKTSETFFNCLSEYNSIDGMNKLPLEFTKIKTKENLFDEYTMQDNFQKKFPNKIGYNCRLTSFLLFKDHIHIENPKKDNINKQNILFDIQSLEEDKFMHMSEEDMTKFLNFYETLSAANSKDQEKQIEVVKNDYNEKKISFDKDIPMSLISVYINSVYSKEDNELFIGHTGILFEYQDSLYFLEKLAFQLPYRLVKLNSRENLKKYLEDKYASYSGETEAKPFIFENDEIL